MDYFILFSTVGFVTGMSSFLILPAAVAALSLPRKLAVV